MTNLSSIYTPQHRAVPTYPTSASPYMAGPSGTRKTKSPHRIKSLETRQKHTPVGLASSAKEAPNAYPYRLTNMVLDSRADSLLRLPPSLEAEGPPPRAPNGSAHTTTPVSLSNHHFLGHDTATARQQSDMFVFGAILPQLRGWHGRFSLSHFLIREMMEGC